MKKLSQIHIFWVLGLAFVIGVGSILLLRPLLAGTDMAADRQTIALFVPFGCAGLCLLWASVTNQLSKKNGILILVMFVGLAFNFWSFFFEPIWHFYFDDPGRYSNYAHLIVSERTLWGADAIGGFGINEAFYVDQPGYRYFLALMILCLGGEHRLLQLVNMGLFLTVIVVYLTTIANIERKVFLPIAVFLVLSLPYAANNILEGLSEWLAVGLTMLSISLAIKRKHYWSVFLISLVPFVRQNYLLFAGLLIFLIVLAEDRYESRVRLGLIALLMISLPLLHNLYFAGEWRFFTVNRGTLIHWDRGIGEVSEQVISVLWWKLKTYFGYWSSADALRTFQALLFAPLGSALLLFYLGSLIHWKRWVYFSMLLLVIGPTVIYGWGYFPRFVFANQVILLSIVPLVFSWRYLDPKGASTTPRGST